MAINYAFMSIITPPIMLSFEIALTDFCPSLEEPVTVRFGPLHTTLQPCSNAANRCLFLQMSPEELGTLMRECPLGLFIPARKCFALASLAHLEMSDTIVCHDIRFQNDDRQLEFQCGLSLQMRTYKEPRAVEMKEAKPRETSPLARNTLAATALRKTNPALRKTNPALRKTNPALRKTNPALRKTNPSFETTGSVFRGVKGGVERKAVTPKEAMRPMPSYESGELQDRQPPMMQFVNDGRSGGFMAKKEMFQRAGPKEVPRHAPQRDRSQPIQESPQIVQSFQLQCASPEFGLEYSSQSPSQTAFKKDKERQEGKGKERKEQGRQKRMSREELRELAARELAAQRGSVMVPILKGDSYELVPLQSLSREEIIQYARKHQLFEEERKKTDELRRKLEVQEREKRQVIAKYQEKISKSERDRSTDKSGKKKGNVVRPAPQIKEETESQPLQESYASDFQSLSISQSNVRILTSRIRALEKEEEYEEQFDSYSHSIISRGNQREAHKISSSGYSDVSESAQQ